MQGKSKSLRSGASLKAWAGWLYAHLASVPEHSLCADLTRTLETVYKALRLLSDKRLTKYSSGGGGT